MTMSVISPISLKSQAPHRNCGNLAVEKLIFRRRTFEPLLGQQHGVARVVDVSEDLHWDHRVVVARHFVDRGKMRDDLIST